MGYRLWQEENLNVVEWSRYREAEVWVGETFEGRIGDESDGGVDRALGKWDPKRMRGIRGWPGDHL